MVPTPSGSQPSSLIHLDGSVYMTKMVPKPLGLGWFPIHVVPNHSPSFIHRVYMEIVVPKPVGLGWFPSWSRMVPI